MAAVRLAETWMKLLDAPAEAKTFMLLVQQVDTDLKYAINCYNFLSTKIRKQPEFYQDWIFECIDATTRAAANMDRFIRGDIMEASPALDARVRHVLMDQPALVSQERSLRYAHSSLLAGINAMHLLMSQQEPPQASNFDLAEDAK